MDTMLHCKMEQGVLVATLLKSNLLTEKDGDAIKQGLLDSVAEHGAEKVVLDFHLVKDIRTPVIGRLAMFHHKLTKELKGKMGMCGLTPHIAEVFDTIRWIDSAGAKGPIISGQTTAAPGSKRTAALIGVVTPDAATAVAQLNQIGERGA